MSGAAHKFTPNEADLVLIFSTVWNSIIKFQHDLDLRNKRLEKYG
jgi:hypothetical protein